MLSVGPRVGATTPIASRLAENQLSSSRGSILSLARLARDQGVDFTIDANPELFATLAGNALDDTQTIIPSDTRFGKLLQRVVKLDLVTVDYRLVAFNESAVSLINPRADEGQLKFAWVELNVDPIAKSTDQGRGMSLTYDLYDTGRATMAGELVDLVPTDDGATSRYLVDVWGNLALHKIVEPPKHGLIEIDAEPVGPEQVDALHMYLQGLPPA